MKKQLLAFILLIAFDTSFSQTPDYYYHSPSNAGVNNLYFNDILSYKFLMIYTQAELASTGMTGATQIHSLWLKSNTAYSLSISDLKITVGHSTFSVPDDTFDNNFNSGASLIVLHEASYSYTMIAGPWNDPPNGWSEIQLTTPFIYNFNDNFVVMMEYSSINYPIPIYADNGGIPFSQLCNIYGGIEATSTTARLMIGFSTEPPSPVAFAATDSSVCQKFCVDFNDLSTTNPVSWNWEFEGGSPSSSTDQNPQQVCYNTPGTFDVNLITTDSNGDNDTLFLNDFITVFPTPVVPTITQLGDSLFSSAAYAYQWQLNGAPISGATDQSYGVTQSGAYSVIVYDEFGCTSQSGIVDVSVTAMEELRASVNVYPNPASGVLIVELLNAQMSGSLSINVVNTLGRQVYYFEEVVSSANGKKEIDLTNISGGVYFIEIKNKQESGRKKVVITE